MKLACERVIPESFNSLIFCDAENLGLKVFRASVIRARCVVKTTQQWVVCWHQPINRGERHASLRLGKIYNYQVPLIALNQKRSHM